MPSLAGAKAATPAGIDGISMAPTLLGQPQDERPFLYRESPGYGGQACIRVGEWKLIRMQATMDPVNNPFVALKLKLTKVTYILTGVVCGVVLALLLRRRRRQVGAPAT